MTGVAGAEAGRPLLGFPTAATYVDVAHLDTAESEQVEAHQGAAPRSGRDLLKHSTSPGMSVYALLGSAMTVCEVHRTMVSARRTHATARDAAAALRAHADALDWLADTTPDETPARADV